MAKRLYVGNLPFSATEDEVRNLFGECGTVELVDLLMDRMTGRPRGFGFVQMDDAGADAAVARLNGYEMGGRALNVNEARERTEGARGERGGDRPRRNSGSRW